MSSVPPILSLTEAQAFTAMRSFLLGACLGSDPAQPVQVIRGQAGVNRVPEPSCPDFVVMSPLGQRRLAYNRTTFVDDVVVGSIAAESFSAYGSIVPATPPYLPSQGLMTVASATGTVVLGVSISGAGVKSGTTVLSQVSGLTGGVGVYLVSTSQTVPAGTAISASWGLLTVSSTPQLQGPLIPGMSLIDGVWPTMSVAPNTVILSQVSGTPGGIGAYLVSPSQTLAQETLYAGLRQDLAATEMSIQLDVHGPRAGDNVRVIDALFRSEYGVEAFEATLEAESAPSYSVVPLNSEIRGELPFVNENDQVEYRWVIDASVQVSPTISTPQQFADQVDITLVDAVTAYPP